MHQVKFHTLLLRSTWQPWRRGRLSPWSRCWWRPRWRNWRSSCGTLRSWRPSWIGRRRPWANYHSCLWPWLKNVPRLQALLLRTCQVTNNMPKHGGLLVNVLNICLQLEQQRQQLLTERQTFHTEQLKQAEMKVRQQREQSGFTGQHSG